MSGNEGIREARVCPRHQAALFMPGYYSGPERDEGVYKLGPGQGNVGSLLHPGCSKR